mgnify:CR=1 FL=1
MRARPLFLAFVAGVWLAASSAAARDIYVSNGSGDDRFNGLQQAPVPGGNGPVRTLDMALRLAQQGDRIVVENTGTPYRESLSLVGSRHSGYADFPFIILGNGAVLDGSAPVPAPVWEHYRDAVFRFQPPRVEYQQLFLNGRPASRVAASAASEEPPKLNALEWCLHRGYIYFAVEGSKLPADYPLSYAARPAGISLLAVQNVLIRDLVIQGYHLDGINALNSCQRVRVERVTCRGNGRSGVATGGASLVDLQDCVLGNNGAAQLLTLPWSETFLRRCDLLSNTAPAWVDQGGKLYRDGEEVRGGLDDFRSQPGPDAPANKPETKSEPGKKKTK